MPTGVTATAQTTTSVLVAWNAAGSATSYRVFRRAPGGAFVSIGTPTVTSFTDTTATPNTSYLYRIRAMNGVVASADSASDIVTTVMFSDDPLVGGGTVVQANHLFQLRAGINAVRQLAGLVPAGFTDAASPGVTVKSVHITEIRSALDAALGPLGFAVGGYTDSTLTGAVVKAVHFQEIRNRLK